LANALLFRNIANTPSATKDRTPQSFWCFSCSASNSAHAASGQARLLLETEKKPRRYRGNLRVIPNTHRVPIVAKLTPIGAKPTPGMLLTLKNGGPIRSRSRGKVP
jgi:hypothetical protein